MLNSQTVLQQRYQIIRLLKTGGMGAIYEACDLRLNSQVAIKQLTIVNPTPQITNAFGREASLLGNLRHPALPRVTDHFTEQNSQFLVMEFITGPDLDEMIQQRGSPFSATEVLPWAWQLLDALEYLHNQHPPILHRDIKPANLKLTTRNQIMLLDFGLAKGSIGLQTITASPNSVFGYTPGYAPLEQIQGTGTDERSDIYALGATLYHLLTSYTPPDALTRASALINGMPDPLRHPQSINPSIPIQVSFVLIKALKMAPNDRYRTTQEMQHDLRKYPSTAPSTIPVVPPTIPVANKPLFSSSAGQPTTRIKTQGSKPVVYKKRLSPFWIMVSTVLILIFIFILSSNLKENAFREEARFSSSDLITPTIKPTPITVFTKHSSPVRAVTWSPNSNNILSEASNQTIHLWRSDGTLINTFKGYKCVWSPDGTKFAMATILDKIEIRATDGSLITSIEAHERSILDLKWSPDSTRLASSSRDNTVMIWSFKRVPTVRLIGHTANVISITWSPDGSKIATASDDKTVKIWTASGLLLSTLEGHRGSVDLVIWNPNLNEETLISVSNDAYLWSTDGTLIRSLDTNGITSLQWSPDGTKILTTAVGQKEAWLWNHDGTLITKIMQSNTILSVAWSPDGTKIISGSTGSDISLWDNNGNYIKSFTGHSGHIFSIDWNSDSSEFVSGAQDNTVRVWKIE